MKSMREVTINMLVCTFHLLGGRGGIGCFVKPSQIEWGAR